MLYPIRLAEHGWIEEYIVIQNSTSDLKYVHVTNYMVASIAEMICPQIQQDQGSFTKSCVWLGLTST
jgi:hypothetical protein